MRFIVLSSILIVAGALAGCTRTALSTSDAPKGLVKDGVSEVSPADARRGTDAAYSQFVDVRTPEEFAAGHAARAKNIPLADLQNQLGNLEKNEPVYLICRTSNRSRQAAKILQDAGFPRVAVVEGGTEGWQAAGLPMVGPASAVEPHAVAEPQDKTKTALLGALKDERRAEATYQSVLSKFPGARPFVNIIEAEKRHQTQLLPLLKKYGVAEPANEFDPAKIPAPATLNDACAAGVQAEKENIALYDEYLKFITEADIKDVFVRLQAASRDNHLPAFTRCVERGGMPGGGPGGPPHGRGGRGPV